MSKKTFTLIILIVLAGIGVAYYWFFIRNASPSIGTYTGSDQESASTVFGGNNPLAYGNTSNGNKHNATSTTTTTLPQAPVAVLRELSTMPVGGMAASTTASTTIIRWIDRGTGRVYQAYADNTAVDQLSSTLIPAVYATYWNKATTAFLLQSLNEDSDAITSFYGTLYPTSTSTSTTTPSRFEIRGTPLPTTTTGIAVSPAGDKVFTLNKNTSGGSTGYISQFNGAKNTAIFTTPLSDLNIDWPASTTIVVATKGYSKSAGFLYSIDQKTGIFNKIIGGIAGLSALVSKDATQVLYTSSNGVGISSFVYNIKSGKTQNLLFNTMPEKCVWSSTAKNIVFCAVPSDIPAASYPEDWYKGNVSFSDSVWEVDTITGDAHIITDLLKSSGQTIDATNLTLDPNENFLYFINKKDLSLWSLSLAN